MPPLLLSLLGSRQAWGVLGLALLLAFAGVQSARLAHAKSDLAAARLALVDPVSRQTWQAEAKATASELAACQTGLGQEDAALASQSAALSDLRRQGLAASAAADAALARAKAQSRASAAKAAAILAAPPAAGCSNADALILKSLEP